MTFTRIETRNPSLALSETLVLMLNIIEAEALTDGAVVWDDPGDA